MNGKKERKPGKKGRLARTLAWIVGVPAALWLLLLAVNWGFSLSLRSYIRGFAPVEYGADRVVPEYDAALGHYAVTAPADRGLRVMLLSDVHLGGGCWSAKKDRKTVYEIVAMLQSEKPDLVILLGDNTFAVPGPVYNGGGTLNNAMAAKDVLEIFEHEGVYFTTVFGNHDTEAFGYTDRVHLGRTYADAKYRYCVFRSEFSDAEAPRPSVSNQFLAVKNADGGVERLLLMLDTNDYIDGSIAATVNWRYDVIHPAQIAWAQREVLELSTKAGLAGNETLKTLCFFHIPIGEYETAYRELAANGFADAGDTEYVEGVWDEEVSESMGGRVWFGGCYRTDEDPAALDGFFEAMGPDGLDTLEACFCGHDHVNDALVRYRGVLLGYNRSVDNLAYTGIDRVGAQRGCTILTLRGGEWSYERKNVYADCGADASRFVPVSPDARLYPDWAPPAAAR